MPGGKEHPYLSPKKNEPQSLLRFPQFTTITSDSSTYIPHNCPLFSKCCINYSGLFLWVFFSLGRLPCHVKLTLNKSVGFSPAALCQFNFQTQPGTLRGPGKAFRHLRSVVGAQGRQFQAIAGACRLPRWAVMGFSWKSQAEDTEYQNRSTEG